MLAFRRARNFRADFDHVPVNVRIVLKVRSKEGTKLRWSHQNFGVPRDFHLKSAKRPNYYDRLTQLVT